MGRNVSMLMARRTWIENDQIKTGINQQSANNTTLSLFVPMEQDVNLFTMIGR